MGTEDFLLALYMCEDGKGKLKGTDSGPKALKYLQRWDQSYICLYINRLGVAMCIAIRAARHNNVYISYTLSTKHTCST